MKKMKIIYLLLCSILYGTFVSCEKSGITDDETIIPEAVFDFEVVNVVSSLEQDQQGNDVIRTTISYSGEEVDSVLFYSGDLGHQFDFKEGRLLMLDSVKASFSTSTDRQEATGQGAEQLSVVVSSDMDPNANLEGVDGIDYVKDARWLNLRSRFRIAPRSEESDPPYQPSGVGDVTIAIEKGRPFHVAFKYETQPFEIFGRFSRIRVRDYVLTAKYKDYHEELLLATGHGENWTMVTEGPTLTGRSFIYTENLLFRGNHSAPTRNSYHAFWAIGLPVTVNDIWIDPLAPQKITSREGTVAYTYYGAGEYEAVFEIFKDGRRQVYRQTISVDLAELSGRANRENVGAASPNNHFNGRSALSRFVKE